MIELLTFLADNCLFLQVARRAVDRKLIVMIRNVDIVSTFTIDPVKENDIIQEYFKPALLSIQKKLGEKE